MQYLVGIMKIVVFVSQCSVGEYGGMLSHVAVNLALIHDE